MDAKIAIGINPLGEMINGLIVYGEKSTVLTLPTRNAYQLEETIRAEVGEDADYLDVSVVGSPAEIEYAKRIFAEDKTHFSKAMHFSYKFI